MTLIQMEYFLMAARERSFTRAASRLFITQQSLSASIAALEEELGCPLFLRRVPLELTYAGAQFRQHAQELLRKVERMKQDLGDISANQRGILQVGIAPTRGRAIMPDIAEAFLKKHPGIRLVINEGTNDGLHQDILNGDIDIAIGNFQEGRTGIALRDFYEEEVALFASDELLDRCFGQEKGPVIEALQRGDFRQLVHCPFVLGNPKDIAGKIGMTVLGALPLQPRSPAQADNAETMLTLCAKGIGLSFCPVILAKTVLPESKYRSLHRFRLGDVGKYRIRFAYRPEEQLWKVMTSFMDIATRLLG